MYFVLSDVHGCHAEMMYALSHWQPDHETLVVLGDLVDRGPASFQVVSTLQQLKQTHGERVVVLKGNHDQAFAQWAGRCDPEMLGYEYKSTYEATVKSFFQSQEKGAKRFKKASRKQKGEHMRRHHKSELNFLLGLHDHFETEHMLFVHAGVNLDRADWWMDTDSMLNTREVFYESDKPFKKRVFFGHTPTSLVRGNHDNSVWFSEHGDKVGLDGGVSMGGQLNAVRVSETGEVLETVVVPAVLKPLF